MEERREDGREHHRQPEEDRARAEDEDKRRGRRPLDVVPAVDERGGGARVLHLVRDHEHSPREGDEAERLRLEEPDEGERREERDDVPSAVAHRHPGRAAHDTAVELRVVLGDHLGEVLRLTRPADHERVPSLVRSTSRPTRKTKRVLPTT